MSGYSREELLNMSMVDLIHPRDREAAVARHQRRMRGEMLPGLYELAIIRKDGSELPIEVTYAPSNYQGKPANVGFIRDITERKRIEKALQLRVQLLENVYDSILACDLDGNIMYVNDTACRSHGYSKEEMLKMNLRDTVVPEQVRLVSEGIKRVIAEGFFPFESEHVRKDGSTFPVEVRAGIVKIGEETVIISVIRDITERKQAEEEIRKFKTISDRASYGVALSTIKGEFTYVNEAFAQMHGYAPSELIGQHYSILYDEGQLKFVTDLRDRTIKAKTYFTTELMRKRKDGTTFPSLTTNVIITDEQNNPLFTSAITIDITEVKKAEEALRDSEARYEALVNLGSAVGEGIVMLQRTDKGDATLTFVNDQMTLLTGYAKQELLNRQWCDLVHPRYREEVSARHKRRMSGELIPGLFEISLVRKDGTEVPVELVATTIKYKGQPATVDYIRDITERKKMEEQLVVTDRLASVGELAAGIAHELNNPLTGIIGFSELLQQKKIPRHIKDDLDIINKEAKRTAQVVRNLLSFARQQPQEKHALDVNKAIQQVLDLRAYEQKVHNIEVKTEFTPDLPTVIANGFQIQQTFLNIIINAEYFMIEAHGKGTLTISTKRLGNLVQVSIADDGPGISKENLQHIFDPFFTTKEVGKGTGLGLSICHGIVTEHGGRIYAESKPGEGATFIIELPIKQPPGRNSHK